MSTDEKSRKRIQKLFSEMHPPVLKPPSNGHDRSVEKILDTAVMEKHEPEMDTNLSNTVRSVDILQARVAELEAQLHNSEERTLPAVNNETRPNSTAPIIYEKEQVGFAFINDEMVSLQQTPQPPADPEKTITSPLMASGQSIGEMQVAQSEQRPLTSDDVNLANAVAQQASTQIENLRLLAAAERARTEAQEATRQFTHKNWATFLDAIHNNERIGYLYDQASVQPFIDSAPAESGYQETVNVLDEHIGQIFLKSDPTRPITDEDKTLVNAIAKQIGQQVENIRLLADAARARSEAEEATRQLTRDNWKKYINKGDEEYGGDYLGFAYDSNQVVSLEKESLPQDIVIQEPLMVRGEAIGQLAVAGLKDAPQEIKDLAASIARQTSIHLETLRLTEELQKRARELQELDRLKSAFLANMSHELRTPLNSILGFADVIIEGLDGPLTENMDNDLKLIQKNGQHLLHLINDVLDMAKIESGKMNLIIEKFNLHEIMEEVTSITAPLASEKNIALFIEPDSDMAVNVNADRTRLRQVLINIINNAIKFTENGKIAIHAVGKAEHVLITVKDNGIGIPPEHLENIFIEFTQVDSSTTRKAGGTGLGLPISRRLIEMHGGRLWAESTGVEGEGATFFIDLPIEPKSVESEPVTKK